MSQVNFEINGKMGYYCAAFLDLLGQKNAMKAIEAPFKEFLEAKRVENDKGAEFVADRLYAALTASVGVIETFHKSYELTKINTQAALDAFLERVPAHLRGITRRELSTDIKHERFSDGIVIYASLEPSEKNSPTQALQMMLGLCGHLHVMQLKMGTPIRGGIDVAPAIDVEGSGLHGPALVNAYLLETNAGYPRVAVGEGLLNFMDAMPEYDPGGHVAREIVKYQHKAASAMVGTDRDGTPILDVFGKGFRSHGPPGVTRQTLGECLQFAREQRSRFEGEKGAEAARVAQKYADLEAYVKGRMHYW